MSNIFKHPNLFKKDSKGNTRVWRMEQNGDEYCTVAGIMGGNLVTSAWTACFGKQKRTNEQQADFEIAAAYKHKSEGEYHYSVDDIDKGAHFYKPMLAKPYAGWPGECFTQPKLDGIRCIVNKDGMFSREGNPIYGAPHIFIQLAKIFEEDSSLVFDGELYNHDLREDFNSISSIVRKQSPTLEQLIESQAIMQYHIYDLPSHTGKFSERIWDLGIIFKKQITPSIVLVPTTEIYSELILDEYNAVFLADGYEGQMVRLNEPYEQKRSKNLLKRKEFQDEEFEVIAIEEGIGNWAGAAKKITCRTKDGKSFGAGIKGSYARGVELLTETHKIATVRYFQLTPDGVPRFGVATKFHGDKRTM